MKQVTIALASVFAIAMGCADTAELKDVDKGVAQHAAEPSAHHAKTIDASELTAGVLDDARLSELVVMDVDLKDELGLHAALPGVHHGKTVDAAELTAGQFDVARLPTATTTAIANNTTRVATNAGRIATNTSGINNNAAVIATKQTRVGQACPAEMAISRVNVNGSVACERIPMRSGFVSVSSVAGVGSTSSFVTGLYGYSGILGRYGVSSSSYIMVPISIPDGARILSFSYRFRDANASVNTWAYLYRSDNRALGYVSSSGSSTAVRSVVDNSILYPVVDNQYSYFVYMWLPNTNTVLAGSARVDFQVQ